MEKWLLDYGVGVSVACALFWGIWKVLVFLGDKLFNNDSGLVNKLTNSHLQMIEELQTNMKNQTDALHEIKDCIKQQTDIATKMDERLNNIELVCTSNNTVLKRVSLCPYSEHKQIATELKAYNEDK